MPHTVKWDAFPEWADLPNNFRKPVAGLKAGVFRGRSRSSERSVRAMKRRDHADDVTINGNWIRP
jgi:hypothetical protein